nr:reverse transcriptase domain-containing protein [Tanacetum cinerariifolium]
MFDKDGKLVVPSNFESHVDCSNSDNACTSNTMEPKIKRFPNSTSLLGRLSRFVCGASISFPRNSINTFEQMAKMFLGKYFPPSMVTKLRNEVTNFRQRPDESLFEAWERYKLSIDRCGTFMKMRPKECYDLIKNMTAHHNDWDTSVQRSESSSSITSFSDPEFVALKAKMAEINTNLMRVLQVNQQVKAVTPNCETCAGPHSYNDCLAIVGQTQNVYAAGAYQGNTITNPKEDLKGITTRSGTAYQGPTIPTTSSSLPKVVEHETETETPILNSEPVVTPIIEPVVAPVSAPKPNQKPSIPYLSRFHDQKLHDKANDQRKKFFQIFQDLNWPDHQNIFPEKLRDPGKFLIACDFLGIDECLALADLGASINLMPLSVWNKISLPELSLTCMTLELSDHSISRPVGVAEDVFIKVGTFLFPADFVVVDFDADPRVPAITFNLDQTSRYSANYNDITANRIDVIDMACEEYSQEVLGFFDVIASGNPTSYYDPIVSTSSPTLTPFGDSDFLLEEVDAFLALEDDPTSPKVDQSYFDPKGNILLLEVFLNDDPSLPHPNQGNYLPQVRKELKICEAKTNKSSIDEPPEVELKDLPHHLEYAFLEGDDKLPVIISKDLSDEEKTALITVLKYTSEPSLGNSPTSRILTRNFVTLKYPSIQKIKKRPHSRVLTKRLPTVACLLVFMDDFSVFGNSFQTCLSHLEKMLKRCEDTNLCLNWEKSYFMVKEGIVIGHKISKNGIEIDKAKVDVITKLPHPTTVKVHTDHSALKYLFAKKDAKARLLRWVMLLQEFDFDVVDTKEAENLAADHLSRLEK